MGLAVRVSPEADLLADLEGQAKSGRHLLPRPYWRGLAASCYLDAMRYWKGYAAGGVSSDSSSPKARAKMSGCAV